MNHRRDVRTEDGPRTAPAGFRAAAAARERTGATADRTSCALPAFATILALLLGPAGSASATPARAGRPTPELRREAAGTIVSADERLRAIVALIDRTRARAAAPGLRDEERDDLADLAWAQANEVLEDPLLRERGQRDPAFLRAQAELLMDDGEDEEALGVLERLRAIAPADPAVHLLRGSALLGLERAPDAVEEYRRALALGAGAPADVRAHLASALSAAGRNEEALAESALAIAADPKGYFAHFVRGWILGELGRGEEERREYLEAVGLERDDAELWARLALSWEEAGQVERAREAWREVLRIDPSDEEAAAKLAGRP